MEDHANQSPRKTLLISPMENSSISLPPKSPSYRNNHRIESPPVLTKEPRSLLQPPIRKLVLSCGASHVDLALWKAYVPNFLGVDTVNQNVINVVFLLKASVASRGLLLKPMYRPPIRCPKAVLDSQPSKYLTLQRSPTPLDASCVGETHESSTKAFVYRTSRVCTRCRARPRKMVWHPLVTWHHTDRM